MSGANERGPVVPDHEALYRAITLPDWWLSDTVRPRPRSAAFSYPSFSTNIASIIGLDGAIRHLAETLACPEGGLVSFNSGVAQGLGFDPRHELDPDDPENTAHANVYSDGGNNQRKRRAKRLAEECCTIVKEPEFATDVGSGE